MNAPLPAPLIRIEDPDQPDIRALLAASDAYHAALYPAESNHLIDIAALRAPGTAFYVARVSGRLAGCGAVVIRADRDYGEVKRMFVAPEMRGLRIGRLLLEMLEAHAQRHGMTTLRLKTGVRQPEAIGLYRSCGYAEIAPFGDYAPDPLSIFMERRLGREPPATACGGSHG